MYRPIYVCVYIYIYIYMYIHIDVCMCMCIHMHIHVDVWTPGAWSGPRSNTCTKMFIMCQWYS